MRFVVNLPRTHIRLGVDDSARSTAFYEALFGGPPASRNTNVIVFEFEEPALLLVLESRPTKGVPQTRPKRAGRHDARRKGPHSVPTGHSTTQARYALVVPDPEDVGKAAVALWRAGAPLRLQDQGIETIDPDGNSWKVRFVPFTKRPAVITVSAEGANAPN
jgi:catechol 2,3-dioxygenase-like lactoylglutathione lyase family enzyme